MGTKWQARLMKLGIALGVTSAVLVWHHWRINAPRRQAIQILTDLCNALDGGDTTTILQIVAVPAVASSRTPPEQAEFVAKALRDEISPQGLATLQARGQFGPLTNLFPAEAETWTQQAGVPVNQCYAFRLDHANGLRSEVVLHTHNGHIRIVRCNNVR